jgi:hypothetical protein
VKLRMALRLSGVPDLAAKWSGYVLYINAHSSTFLMDVVGRHSRYHANEPIIAIPPPLSSTPLPEHVAHRSRYPFHVSHISFLFFQALPDHAQPSVSKLGNCHLHFLPLPPYLHQFSTDPDEFGIVGKPLSTRVDHCYE